MDSIVKQVGIEEMFATSNINPKQWKKVQIDNNHYHITKPGKQCEYCSKKFNEIIYRSIRVSYSTFKSSIDGLNKTEFEWVNSKCRCVTVIIYKNGSFAFELGEEYDKLTATAEKLKKFGNSNIKIFVRKNKK